MKLGFISDLHLSENTPSVTEGFFEFLKTAAQELSHLYILGDLFEAWVGDDDNSELATGVMQKLNHATRNGLEIFFIHGNRDFLCGQKFAEQSNLTLLPDPFFLNFFDLKIALSHGDSFCTEDLEYMRFKKEVRSQEWQQEFLQKPLNVVLILHQICVMLVKKIIVIKMFRLWMSLLRLLKNFLMNII